MPAKLSVFVATSLDGYIARRDGGIDWLDKANASVPEGEDCGFSHFLGSVDAIVMGRATFETVAGFPEWPYGEKPVFVLSASLRQLPPTTPPRVSLRCADPASVVRRLAEEGYRHLYVDGGRTIQAFLAAGLVSDLTVTVIPILLGSGIRLFGELAADTPVCLQSVRVFPFGFVQSHYSVCRGADGDKTDNLGKAPGEGPKT